MLSRQCTRLFHSLRQFHVPAVSTVASARCELQIQNLQVKNQTRFLTTPSDRNSENDSKNVSNRFSRFHITMSQEEKKEKKKAIEMSKLEEKPTGLVAKFKFYFKRYWYIAVPVHTASCILYFGLSYLIVRSGVDVIALLEWLHVPEVVVEKVRNTPKTAGVVVVALILYKIATPLKYATTIAGIRLTFKILQKLGKLKTAREVEFGVRTGYEKYSSAIRSLNQRRVANFLVKPSRKKSE